jgi:hypothetical protein
MIDALQFYQTNISPVTRYVIPLLGILALWIGLVRMGLTPRARTIGIVVTGLLLVWRGASEFLGWSGFYTQHWDLMRPVGWMIAILWLIALMRSATIGGVLDALPLWLLPIAQVYRASGGLVWFTLVATGQLPASFGLVTGVGDTLAGVFGVVTAIWLYSGARGARVAAIAWNIFGILDFTIGFTVGSFVTYSVAYPAVIIPAFMAPFSLDLHALSLRQLIRASNRERGALMLANAKIA